MSRAARTKLQNFLIVLLSVTAALLFWESRRLSQGNGALSSLFSAPTSPVGDTAPAEIASLPLRFAVAGPYAAYGGLGMTTADEDFSAAGALLREALGSASRRQAASREELLSALRGGSAAYYDFLAPLPASLLGRHLDCEVPQGLSTVRRLLLSLKEDGVILYCGTEGAYSRYETRVSGEDLSALVNDCQLSGVSFAAQLSQAEGLDPLSLLPGDEALSVPQLSAASCTAESTLWSLLGFNPRTNSRYAESDGTQVILEGESTLRLQPGAVVRYESSGTGISLSGQASFTAGEAVEAGGRFLTLLLQSCGSGTGLLLREASPTLDGWRLLFDYHAGGYPIRSGSGAAMASLTLRGTEVTELELPLRRYTVTEEASPLLPLTQALAIARRCAGAELVIGYLDGGGETLSAGWLAE